MGQLQEIAPKLVELGYQIVAISPDRPEKLQRSRDKNKLDYVLLSDSKMDAARAFGIAFKIGDDAVKRLKHYGIDIEADTGQTHHLLPVPSVFLFDKYGKIVFQYVNPNYQVRIDPDVLLAAARSAAK